MPLTLPESLERTVDQVVRASDEQIGALEKFLRSIEPTLFDGSTVNSLYSGSVASNFSLTDFQVLMRGIISFHTGQIGLQISQEKFIEDIFESDYVSKHLDEPQQRLLRSRLPRLLDSPSIRLSAKATDILFDTPAHLIAGRILTDIRPIFSDDEIVTLESALITHTFKLEFHEGNTRKTLFLSLDLSDIDALQDTLGRAKLKAEASRAMLLASKTRLIDKSNTVDSPNAYGSDE